MLDVNISDNRTHSVLSLFSGGGLLDLGFINQGFQIEKALEINKSFIEGYNYAMKDYFSNTSNFFVSQKLVYHKDIKEQVDASNQEIQKEIGNTYQGITGIIGGPPCQDYSVGGKNEGIKGERGKLILSYLNFVKSVRPAFLFFENVAGLYRTKEHRKGFTYLIENLKKNGYELWFDILNPLEYGIPQDRPRIIVVGFRKEIVSKLLGAGFSLSHDNQKLKNTNSEELIFKWPKVLFHDPKNSIDWPNRWGFMGQEMEEEISKIPDKYKVLQVSRAFSGLTELTPNQKEFFKPKSEKFWVIEEGDTFRKSFKRLHRYRFSPTVAYGNNEVHLHPTEARRLTVREALRLQSVPDEYILPSNLTLTSKFKIISNGVPTKQAELIALEIRKTLYKYSLVDS
ncbi:DNA cytosine methyltransferase [Bacillus sp. V59.32b]|uniref:DNA cytosine methyltransferase n=1 Tax=Bacillus sp. V59.32b TaxID=1758642 RepID=UPI00135BBB94|nr:DNA cytosine methyltransferase [Bacillus sp. V59.32b]